MSNTLKESWILMMMDHTYISCLNAFRHNILSMRDECFCLSILTLFDFIDLLVHRFINGLLLEWIDLEMSVD